MKKIIFEGAAVALVTPFKNGKVDYASLKKLLNFQVNNKTKTIVVLGTTGEPSTLSDLEKREIVVFCKQNLPKNIKLIVGSGGNNTQKVIQDSLLYKSLGADALLIVSPYYNKCSEEGLIIHYKKIAKEVKYPIIIYNVPGRTGVNISAEVAVKLSKVPYICGIKEASGNIEQILRLCVLLKNRMAVYSGDDSLNYIFMCLGAKGAISVTANVLPQKINIMCKNFNIKKGKLLNDKLYNINKLLFCDVNPIPVKFALSYLGLIRNELRLPLTPIKEDKENSLKQELFKIF